jgi:Uma2 family endonuclease
MGNIHPTSGGVCGFVNPIRSASHGPGTRLRADWRIMCNAELPPLSVQREPATHLEPDILVVPESSRPDRITPETKWTEYGHAWLVVEVSGKGSRVYDRDYKVRAYLALGVLEMWRIDLQERCAYVARKEQPVLRRPDYLTWHPPGMQEPLTLSIASLFEGTDS